MKDKSYEVVINANEFIELELVFAPTEVASYEFVLPVSVNAPDASVASSGWTEGSPDSEIRRPTRDSRQRKPLGLLAPRRKISAIGLRQTLRISSTKLAFKIPLMYLEKLREGGFYEAKVKTL